MIYLLEGTVKTESRVFFLVDAIDKFDAAQKVLKGNEFLRCEIETINESFPTDFVFHGTYHPFDEQTPKNMPVDDIMPLDEWGVPIRKDLYD